MQKQKKPFFIISLLVLIFLGVVLIFNNKNSSDSKQASDKPQIIVSILPQVQIVEKIVGDSADVTALIPPGFNPATYEPTTKDLKAVIQANIYFLIGQVPFEKVNLPKLEEINPSMKVVDTSINNKLRIIEEHDHEDEHAEGEDHDGEDHADDAHDRDDDHDHGDESEIDPHVWLSPKMVKQQAEVIKNSLVEAYPANKKLYEANYQQLTTELDELDKQLVLAFAPIKGKTMLVYHPAFGYLADEYGFIQEHIEIEGKEPSITELQNIINQAKQEGTRVIFVQKQFSSDSAKSIAENINGAVVQIDPLSPDYLSNIRNLADTISSKIMR